MSIIIIAVAKDMANHTSLALIKYQTNLILTNPTTYKCKFEIELFLI